MRLAEVSVSVASRMPRSEAMTNWPALAQLVLLDSLVISITSPAASLPSAVGMR